MTADPIQQESDSIGRQWYTAPTPPPPRGWLVFNKDFVLAALQGCMADPTLARPTGPWMLLTRIVMAVMAVLQAIIIGLARIPVLSWAVEIIARTFTRNGFGFFLRSAYWKGQLKSLGQNTIIDQNVEIWGAENVTIGSHCHIDTFVRLGAGNRKQGQRGSIEIGNYVHLGPGVHIAGRGGVKIGDLVGVSANAHIYSATGVAMIPSDPGLLVSMSHMAPKDQQLVNEAPVLIEDYAFIGIMARIMPGVTIGRGAIIHANTELARSVPAFSNFGGTPRGRHIGWRKPLRRSLLLGTDGNGNLSEWGKSPQKTTERTTPQGSNSPAIDERNESSQRSKS
ncbi:MAG TPA: acyltransferase [Phycisphaerae bacterium]|nr:acyltransferase [Phycisphaerae bacterium]